MGCSNSSRAQNPVKLQPEGQSEHREFILDPLAVFEFDDFACEKFSMGVISQERIKFEIVKMKNYGIQETYTDAETLRENNSSPLGKSKTLKKAYTNVPIDEEKV